MLAITPGGYFSGRIPHGFGTLVGGPTLIHISPSKFLRCAMASAVGLQARRIAILRRSSRRVRRLEPRFPSVPSGDRRGSRGGGEFHLGFVDNVGIERTSARLPGHGIRVKRGEEMLFHPSYYILISVQTHAISSLPKKPGAIRDSVATSCRGIHFAPWKSQLFLGSRTS